MQTDDEGTDAVAGRIGIRRADPPVVLPDGVVVVALPAVAQDEDVGHPRGGSFSAAIACLLAFVAVGVGHLVTALVVRDEEVLLGLAGDAAKRHR